MKNKKHIALLKVERISDSIVQNINVFDEMPISLMSGKAGIILFFTQRYLLEKKDETYIFIGGLLEKLVFDLNNKTYGLSYCDGLSGVAFMLNYLKNNGIYSEDLSDILDDIDSILINNLSHCIIEDDIDFLHGKLGLYYYLITRGVKDKAFKKEINSFADYIRAYLIDVLDEKNEKVFNVGMAHGFCAIICILIKYSIKYKTNEYDEILKRSIDIIIELKSIDENIFSLFPSQAADINNMSMYRIPLGWCYGDQIITLTLRYYAEYSGNEKIIILANAISQHWKNRNKTHLIYPSGQFDYILCHGLSMVAYLNKKWFFHSGDKEFLENYNILLAEILETDDKIGVAGYRKKINSQEWEDSYTFLDGVSGIGIFLLDFLGAPNLWDTHLLLDI